MAAKKSTNPSIDEQALRERLQIVQNRVWRATNIAHMIAETSTPDSPVEDPMAAAEALVEYLGRLHLDMDVEFLIRGERAAEG